MMQIIDGTERYYCRVEGCDEFTADNVPYGYCGMHALEKLGGAEPQEKPFPPVGSVWTQGGVFHGDS